MSMNPDTPTTADTATTSDEASAGGRTPGNRRRAIRLAVAALVAIVAVFGFAGAAVAYSTQRTRTFTVEVAENGTVFIFDDAPVFDDGYPAAGNGFVTQGYLYPEGTLDGTDGVNDDGTPEYPDEVIGTWTCYGYFIADGAQTTDEAWVVTSQIFELDGGQIVTQGFELPPGAGDAIRSVTGGTGRYANARGESIQTTEGFNPTEGVVASISFDLRGVGRR